MIDVVKSNIVFDSRKLVKDAYLEYLASGKYSFLAYMQREVEKNRYQKYLNNQQFKQYCFVEVDRLFMKTTTKH